jgi:hypothetical protein
MSHFSGPSFSRVIVPGVIYVSLRLLGMHCFAADVYSCEHLAEGQFLSGQDLWIGEPGQGAAVVSFDMTGNGTKVLRHHKVGISEPAATLTRTNEANFNFVPFLGTETNAIIQFEATGEYVAMFGLGRDLNGDGLLLAADGELGPCFGVYDRNLRIWQANLGPAYDDGFNEGGGDGNSGNEWYRIQLRINFSALDGDGMATLAIMNLSDGENYFQTVSGMRNRPLGLKRLLPGSQPANWNAMWILLHSNGNNVPSMDNLIPNLKGIRITGIEIHGERAVLSWRGGTGPYQVQRCASIESAAWENLGVLTTTLATEIDVAGAVGFLRVVQP